MSLTPEDEEILKPKKRGGSLPRFTPEQQAQKKRDYNRELEKVRGDKVKAFRLKPEVIEAITPYITPDKSLNALVNEALMVYKNTMPLPK